LAEVVGYLRRKKYGKGLFLENRKRRSFADPLQSIHLEITTRISFT
jgi:hypothetical protein